MSDRSLRPFVKVLGIAQDGGYPHIGCRKPCCTEAWENRDLERKVTALGLIDPRSGQCWLFEATPDIGRQIHTLLENGTTGNLASPPTGSTLPHRTLAGIFLTHAHLGHYFGLAFLGREALGAPGVPVYVMPRLRHFLESNAPWRMLIELNNIELRDVNDGIGLAEDLRVTPFLVPHRGEFSETVGFRITGPSEAVIFLPDIDRWDAWPEFLPDVVRSASAAYLDGTFFSDSELPGRTLAEIPHPPVAETMRLLSDLSIDDRARVRFLHLNHTNPLLRPDSLELRDLNERGFRTAAEGEIVFL